MLVCAELPACEPWLPSSVDATKIRSKPLFCPCFFYTLDFLRWPVGGERVLPNLLSGHGRRAPPMVRIKGVCMHVCMCTSSHRTGTGGASPKGEWCPAVRRNNACLVVC